MDERSTDERALEDRPSIDRDDAKLSQSPHKTSKDSPYRQYETGELLALIEDLQRSDAEASQEADQARSDEDRQDARRRGVRIWNQISEIDSELARRRADRQAKGSAQGNPPVDGRPYQFHETSELLALIEDLQRSDAEASQEADQARSDEDRQDARRRGVRIWNQISEIDSELARRRKDRQARQPQHDSNPGPAD